MNSNNLPKGNHSSITGFSLSESTPKLQQQTQSSPPSSNIPLPSSALSPSTQLPQMMLNSTFLPPSADFTKSSMMPVRCATPALAAPSGLPIVSSLLPGSNFPANLTNEQLSQLHLLQLQQHSQIQAYQQLQQLHQLQPTQGMLPAAQLLYGLPSLTHGSALQLQQQKAQMQHMHVMQLLQQQQQLLAYQQLLAQDQLAKDLAKQSQSVESKTSDAELHELLTQLANSSVPNDSKEKNLASSNGGARQSAVRSREVPVLTDPGAGRSSSSLPALNNQHTHPTERNTTSLRERNQSVERQNGGAFPITQSPKELPNEANGHNDSHPRGWSSSTGDTSKADLLQELSSTINSLENAQPPLSINEVKKNSLPITSNSEVPSASPVQNLDTYHYPKLTKNRSSAFAELLATLDGSGNDNPTTLPNPQIGQPVLATQPLPEFSFRNILQLGESEAPHGFSFRHKSSPVSFDDLWQASLQAHPPGSTPTSPQAPYSVLTSSHATRISSLADEGIPWSKDLCDTSGRFPTGALENPSPEDWFHSWQLNRRVTAKWLFGAESAVNFILFDISKYYACNYEGSIVEFLNTDIPTPETLAKFLELTKAHLATFPQQGEALIVHVATSYFNCSSRKRAAPECGAKLNTQLWFDCKTREFFESVEGAKKTNNKNVHSSACRACHKSRLPPSVTTLRVVDKLLMAGHSPSVVEEIIRNAAIKKCGGVLDDGRLIATTGTIFNRQRKVRIEQSRLGKVMTTRPKNQDSSSNQDGTGPHVLRSRSLRAGRNNAIEALASLTRTPSPKDTTEEDTSSEESLPRASAMQTDSFGTSNKKNSPSRRSDRSLSDSMMSEEEDQITQDESDVSEEWTEQQDKTGKKRSRPKSAMQIPTPPKKIKKDD